MLGTASQVEVSHVPAVHTLLDGEIEHRLLLSVLNTRDASLVALLIVELHVLDDGDRQVLQRRLHITEHELLTVEQDLLHLLAIHGDITILIHLSTRHTFDELLNGRAFRCTEGIRVIHQRVFLHHHLRSLCCDNGLFQHHALRRHPQTAQFLVLVTPQCHLTLDGLVTYGGNLQTVGTVRWCLDREITLVVTHRSTHEGTVVGSKQLHRGLQDRFLLISIQ